MSVNQPKIEPPTVSVFETVHAPIQKVWELFRPFGSEIMKWWPIYEWVRLDESGRDEIGAVRSFKTKTGRTYKEKLLVRDDVKFIEQYAFVSVEPWLPIESVLTTIEMRARGPSQTEVRWSSVTHANFLMLSQIKLTQWQTYRDAILSLDKYFNPPIGSVDVTVVQAAELPRSGLFSPNAYVVAELDGQSTQRTRARVLSTHPVWNETLHFDITDRDAKLHLAVTEASIGRDNPIGSITVDLRQLVPGTVATQTLPLQHAKSGQLTTQVLLNLGTNANADQSGGGNIVSVKQVLGLIQKEALAVLEHAVEGDPKTFLYERYPRNKEIPDVPLEALPPMVAGLPPGQELSPNKVARVIERAAGYVVSQRGFEKRLAAALANGSDPFNAYFGPPIERPNYVADHWAEDAELCRQLIQGVNPMVIQLCRAVEEVPPEMRQLRAQDRSIAQLIADKRLFILDYAEIAPLKQHRNMYLYAPFMLVYRELRDGGESRLNILGIQLTRNADKNEVYTPSSATPNRYLFAKIQVANADNQYHQFIYHLGLGHLALEPFAIAHHNAFPKEHLIGSLLKPHFHDTIGINYLARQTLVADVAPFTDRTFSPGTAQALQLFLGAWQKFDFFANSFPQALAARGFDEQGSDGVENFYYRDDGFKIWHALEDYVKDVVDITYVNDAAVATDPVLKVWIGEMTDPKKADIRGFPAVLDSKALLVKTLTTIIFMASAQHSAVNYPQLRFLSYVPNRPDSVYRPMPPGNEDLTADFITSAMPNVEVSHFQVSFAWLLTLPAEQPLTTVDAFAKDHPDIYKRFMDNLSKISAAIKQRNETLVAQGKDPYDFLLPEKVAASVAI